MFGFTRHDVRLLFNLLKMNIRDRYLGSSLGSVWAVTNPLFMLSLYTYVFGFVFKIKLPGAETTLAYVVWLISGLGPWNAGVEAVIGSANSVVGASGMVKNMAFKTELLPVAGALVGLINLTVSLVFILILLICSGSAFGWNILLLPIIVAVQFAWAIAIGTWLSVIAVFVRDVLQILPTLFMALLFMTPIFYSFGQMPGIIQKISLFNPFYQIAEAYRTILVDHHHPDILGMLYVAVLSIVVYHYGLGAFRRAKGSFDSAI